MEATEALIKYGIQPQASLDRSGAETPEGQQYITSLGHFSIVTL